MVDWWTSSRKKIAKGSRGGFNSMVVLVWWTVWRERNNRVFNGAMQQAASLASWIREEASKWVSSTLGTLMLLDTAMH
jgi:hypothetical protein